MGPSGIAAGPTRLKDIPLAQRRRGDEPDATAPLRSAGSSAGEAGADARGSGCELGIDLMPGHPNHHEAKLLQPLLPQLLLLERSRVGVLGKTVGLHDHPLVAEQEVHPGPTPLAVQDPNLRLGEQLLGCKIESADRLQR